MNVLLAAAVVAGSAFLVERMRLPGHVGEVMRHARRCRRILADAERPDLEKERAMRVEAIELFRLFGRLSAGSLVAIGVPLAIVGGLGAIGWTSTSDVLGTMVRPGFLVSVFAVGAVIELWRRRSRR